MPKVPYYVQSFSTFSLILDRKSSYILIIKIESSKGKNSPQKLKINNNSIAVSESLKLLGNEIGYL